MCVCVYVSERETVGACVLSLFDHARTHTHTRTRRHVLTQGDGGLESLDACSTSCSSTLLEIPSRKESGKPKQGHSFISTQIAHTHTHLSLMQSRELVYCNHCDDVRSAGRTRNGTLACSHCHTTEVQVLSSEAASGHTSPPSTPSPSPNAARGGNDTSRRGRANPAAAYYENFRRWMQAVREHRHHRGNPYQRPPPPDFPSWWSAAVSAGDSASVDVHVLAGQAPRGMSQGRMGLPMEVRDFTTDEILSTLMVLQHGVHDTDALGALLTHGELCVPRLNAEGNERAERRRSGERPAGKDDGQPPPLSPSAAPHTEQQEQEEEPALPCCICMAEMLGDDTDAAVVLHCKHFFHYSCLFEWIDLENFNCPMCRASIIQL